MNPLSLHDRCFDLDMGPPETVVPNAPSRFRHRLLDVQNDETPVGSAFRGLVRDRSGDCHRVSPATPSMWD